MLEHTFRAERFDDAMAKVKERFGSDALIVSRRHLSKGRALDGGRALVEIVAMPPAANDDPSGFGVSIPGPVTAGTMLEQRLVRVGVPESTARAIASSASSYQHEGGNRTSMRDALARSLQELMLLAGPIDGRIRTVALVGPTGAGKTTTIAKIAARAALMQNRRVALVSIDRYRIGGTEQLQRYADLIGIRMEVASDEASLEIALRKLSDAELVLIDTAGRSPKDVDALAAMGDCLRGVQEPVEVQLCVPASTRDREVEILAERYAVVGPTRFISTKVDEALFGGAIVAAQVRLGLPLTYLTTGQRVPEDIESATPDLLSALLLGEEALLS